MQGGIAGIFQLIAQSHGVLFPVHGQFFFHLYPLPLVDPPGQAVHLGKAKVLPTFLGAALGKGLGGKMGSGPVPGQFLLHPVDDVPPHIGGPGAGHQQGVVIAGSPAGKGLGAKAPQPVGQQKAVLRSVGAVCQVLFAKHKTHGISFFLTVGMVCPESGPCRAPP